MSRPLSIILVVSTNPPVLRSKSEMPFADNSLSANKTGHSWICVYLDPPCVTQSFQCCSHFLGVFGGSSYRAIMFEKFTSRPKDSLNCWILQWLAGVKGWSLIHPKPKKQEAFRDQRWNKQHSYTKTFFAAPKLGLHRQMSQKDQKLERSILMLVKWSKGFDPTMETFLNVTITYGHCTPKIVAICVE